MIEIDERQAGLSWQLLRGQVARGLRDARARDDQPSVLGSYCSGDVVLALTLDGSLASAMQQRCRRMSTRVVDVQQGDGELRILVREDLDDGVLHGLLVRQREQVRLTVLQYLPAVG